MREQKRLKTYLGRVIRDVERKVASSQATLSETQQRQLNSLLATAKQIHGQQRHDKDKCYSAHAPEVECIAKGKSHKPYAFGVKVGGDQQ